MSFRALNERNPPSHVQTYRECNRYKSRLLASVPIPAVPTIGITGKVAVGKSSPPGIGWIRDQIVDAGSASWDAATAERPYDLEVRLYSTANASASSAVNSRWMVRLNLPSS